MIGSIAGLVILFTIAILFTISIGWSLCQARLRQFGVASPWWATDDVIGSLALASISWCLVAYLVGSLAAKVAA